MHAHDTVRTSDAVCSEMRAAYEVGKAAQREVILGAPTIFTPAEYLRTLSTCQRQ